jgi:hypothetical protein
MLTAVSAPLPVRAGLAGVAILAACAAAHAQFVTGFEHPPYNASIHGTTLTGQDGWGVLAGGNSLYAYPYQSNDLGFPANPTGDSQFVAGGGSVGGGSGSTNASRPVDFSAGGAWTASWDVAMRFTGTSVSTTNNGGLSLFTTSQRQWSTLNSWTDLTATAWNATVIPYDADGNRAAVPGFLPGPAFGNLLLDHWYRESITWSFDTNLISSVSITDLVNGTTSTESPQGWYLTGGAHSNAPLPTSVRILAQGNLGTVTGYDNFSFAQVPSPAGSLVLLAGGVSLAFRRRR